MVFAIDLELLKKNPFQYQKAEPGELKVGEYRFEVFACWVPEREIVMIDIRPTTKTKERR